MDQNADNDYTGTELDPGLDLDFDFDDEDEEQDDLIRIVGVAAGAAALLGGIMLLLSRRQKKHGLEAIVEQVSNQADDLGKALQKVDLSGLLDQARSRANDVAGNVDLSDLSTQARRAARRAAKQASDAAGNVDLSGVGDQAQKIAKRTAKRAGQAADDFDLQEALDDLQQRLATIEREGRRQARRAGKEVSKRASNVDTDQISSDIGDQISKIWETVSSRAKDIGWEDAFNEAQHQVNTLTKTARKQVAKTDLSGASDLLDTLRGRVGDAIDSLRDDVLPDVQDRIESDVVPGAKEIAKKARKRGEKIAKDATPVARKAADQAGGFSSMLGDLIGGLALQAVEHLLSDVVPQAQKGGKQAGAVLRDQTAPWVRHRAGEARDFARDEVAPRVGDAFSNAPGAAKKAADTAGPVVSDTLSNAASMLSDALDKARPSLSKAADKAGSAVSDSGSGIGGAISTIGGKAGGAVGATVDTTKYLTAETSRILLWLSMLGSLVLLVFVPDRDKQREIWANVQGFLGELGDMWGDFSDKDFADDDEDAEEGSAEA